MPFVETSLTPERFPGDKNWKAAFRVCLWIVEAIIIVVALVGNVLVVYAFVTYKRLRVNVTNYFVISLAISDILITAIVNPLKLDANINKEVWTHGSFMCGVYTTMYLLAVPSSVINLCAVTVDRYLVLRVPLRYSSLMPHRRALLIIGGLWVYAITWACLPVMGWGNDHPYIIDGYCTFVSKRSYNTTVNIVNFLIPMVLLAIFWYFIYNIARKHAKRVKQIETSLSLNTNEPSNFSNICTGNAAPMNKNNATRREKSESKKIRRNVRGSRYIGIIVLLFYLCWLPYVIISLIGNLCPFCIENHLIPRELYDAFLVLGFMNSALNPFLYPFHDKHFKEAFRDMWIKLKRKVPFRFYKK